MEQTMTVSEVAKLLRMSKTSIYKWAETGKIPSVKIGVNLRFTETQIKNFLSTNTRASQKPTIVKTR
jgi:PTS system nitrogen regulatory IIA component